MKQNLLQRILFPDSECVGERELFYKTEKAGAVCGEKVLEIAPYSRLDFNTYFNAFSCAKWSRYTNVRTVSLRLELSGDAEVSLVHNFVLSDKLNSKILKTVQVSGEEKQWIELDFGELMTIGNYSFSVTSKGQPVRIFDGAYVTYDQLPEKDVKLALIFTTYHREAYIRKNLELLEGRFSGEIHIYIVDNASSLQIESNENHTVIQNKNVGGAGGFARGMLKVMDDAACGFTHILIMDDDVLIYPAVIERLLLLLPCVKEEYEKAFVGGSMLRMDIPYIQSESGGIWNRESAVPFGFLTDLRDSFACIKNEFDHPSDYNAWWFCVVPISYLKEDNLPLPLFVFNDDVDYGLRNQKDLILMNGLCIWHEPFDSKFNAMRMYYQTRNVAIVNSVHNMALSEKEFLNMISEKVLTELELYRYSNAECIIKGAQDFLKGPEWLAGLDAESYNSEILRFNRKLEKLEKLELDRPFDYSWYQFCTSIPYMNKAKRGWKYFRERGTYLGKGRFLILPLYNTRLVKAYRNTAGILYYDELSHQGFVARPDEAEKKRLEGMLRGLQKQIKGRYSQAVSEYSNAYAYLTSRKQWETYLGI
ncbi:MAG: glycosyltransferase [Parasporobacterium sp.]|nr:glycosyltransferase [Parasporobacterium sp.]